jgi:hypothetical protein
MAFTALSLIALIALIAWRFVFTDLRRRSLSREIVAPQRRHNNALKRGLQILNVRGLAAITDSSSGNGSEGVRLITPKDRARAYLRRIIALTGATQVDDTYVLDVGKTRFHVRDRYVRRIRDVTDPQCAYEETCFYSMHKEMPKAEHIASALLQLKNKPALFDRWAAQNGAFKADGQAFSAPE